MKKNLFGKFLTIPVLFLFVIFQLTGCKNKRDLSENVVIAHIVTEPTTLHPTNGATSARSFIFDYTQKMLLRTDLRTQQTVPDLVKSLPKISKDGLKYTFELKDGIKWDDGEPFTVDDIIFTLKMVKCPLTDNAWIRPYYSRIEGVVKDSINPNKFTLVCNDIYYGNPLIFEAYIYMLQKSYWDKNGVMDSFKISDFNSPDFDGSKHPKLVKFMQDFNSGDNGRVPDKLQGLGPYKVTEWNTGNTIVLKRKENWWGDNSDFVYDQNYPEKIIFKVIRDDAGASLALKNQTIDVSTFIGTDELLKLQKLDYFNEDYYSSFQDNYSYNYIALNMRPDGINQEPFFIDKRVRRAMAYLVPIDEIIDVIAKGHATRLPANVSPLKPSFNDTLKLIPFDIEKAKQLLDAAGWIDTDGDNIRDKQVDGEKLEFKFRMSYSPSPTRKDIILMIKNEMYKAGIDLEPDPMDFSVFLQKAANHEFDAIFGGWGGGPGPQDPEQLWHTRNWANKGSNYAGFGNAETDSLIELANKTLDIKARNEIMKQIQAKIYEEQPYVFLYSHQQRIVIHKRFDNADMYPVLPGVILNNLKLKEQYKEKGFFSETP